MRRAVGISCVVLVTSFLACETTETLADDDGGAASSSISSSVVSSSMVSSSTGQFAASSSSSSASSSGSASSSSGAGGTGGAGGQGGAGASGGFGGAGGAPPLGPGALQFIGVNADTPEGFALVALVDIPSGTALRFTERAWNETNGAFEVLEGTATLTLNTTLTAGTVFEVEVSPPTTLSVVPNIGAIVNDGTGNWGIAGSGDNLFVYVGDHTSPTFIAGTAFAGSNVWTTDGGSLDGQSSMIPSSLSEGAGTITTFSDNNLRYNGPRTGEGTIGAYLSLIADETTNYETGATAYTPLRGTDFTP